MPYKDPEVRKLKNKEYTSKHYATHKEQYLANNRKRDRILMDFLEEYRKQHPCVHCGETDTCCLDMHHVDPSTKEGNISLLVRGGSMKKLKEELAKCISLCSNCHRKFHAGKIVIDEFSPAG